MELANLPLPINVGQFIALGSGGEMFLIAADGRSSYIGNNRFGGNSIAKNSAEAFFTVVDLPNDASFLIEIDLKTGLGNPVTQFGSLNVRGLAFSTEDELFAISEANLPIYELFKLDLETGQQTLVGNAGFSPIQGLDFALDGTLYGWDIENGLVTIDSNTGEVTDVNAAINADVDIQGIAFTDGDRLFGGRDALYEIDVETGETTFIGKGDYSDLRGLTAITAGQPSEGEFALFGLAHDGSLYQLDKDGSGALQSDSGFSGNSLARNSAGKLFTVSESSEGDHTLVTIDPKTGLGDIVSQLEALDVRGLAFSDNDELFGIRLFSGPAEGDSLYKLDVQTGEQTFVGSTVGFTTIEGLDFAPDGTLYGWDLESGLVTINSQTGAATDVNPEIGADVPIQGLVFTDSGRLFGARDALYEINTETGKATYIRKIDQSSLRGLEFKTVITPNAISISGTRKQDVLAGQRSDDLLIGLGSNDKLLGRAGNDTLYGGGGKDHIKGGSGDDVLGGGQGRDILTGNRGRDIFVLAVGQGQDTISDFKDGVDSLGLDDRLSFGDIDIFGRSGNTLIRYNNRTLATLTNVNASAISVEDFTFL